MTLADELRAVCRGLYRMRSELKGSAAWVHVEAACTELQKAVILLMRGNKDVTTL